MTTAERVCPRDGVETALACTNCGTPICPQCLVRTSVGFRCESCAARSAPASRGLPLGWIGAIVAIAVAAIVVVLVVVHPWSSSPAPKVTSGGGAPAGFAVEVRVSGGYSLDVPTSWSPVGDDTPTQLSYAATPPTAGAVHVFLHQTSLDLATWLNGFTAGFPNVGAVGIHTEATQVAGLPGMLLGYQQPASSNPGAPVVTFLTYLVKKDGTIFNLQLSSVQNGTPPAAFAQIVSSFTLR